MSEKIKVINLKPGMENISIDVRVIESLGVRTVNTKSGVRTLGEYMVGDDSGRVKLVVWGSKAASLSSGDSISIKNAWVTTFRGEVQLNAGKNSVIEKIPSENVPEVSTIPTTSPTPSKEEERPTTRPPRRRGRDYRRRSW